MSRLTVNNLKAVRARLGKSQGELALLLGVSIRAIQSYEQGWRNVPSHVLRGMMMLLFLDWRKGQSWIAPCWDIQKCEQKDSCSAWVLRAGDMCWQVTGTQCGPTLHKTPEAKLDQCARCPVTARWLAP
jgi:DNA-binding XRE family transcriptional regulator